MAHDDNEGAGVELHDYIRILRKNWITILLLTLLGAGAATTYSLLTTPKYETTAQLYVSVQSQAAATDLSKTKERDMKIYLTQEVWAKKELLSREAQRFVQRARCAHLLLPVRICQCQVSMTCNHRFGRTSKPRAPSLPRAHDWACKCAGLQTGERSALTSSTRPPLETAR